MNRTLCHLLAWAFALATPTARAFEGWEHERMGNLAFHLAHAMYCADKDGPSPPSCDRIKGMFKDPLNGGADGPEDYSYGALVRCVDFFLTPEKMLAGRDDRAIFSIAQARRRSQAESGPAPRRTAADFLNVDVAQRCHETLLNFSYNQASHSNHAHFQSELVTSQNLYHRLAIEAAHDGDTLRALVINAISDHYLHDFFAPGHIVTLRSHMSDIYANAVHDSINHKSARLRYSRDSLVILLSSMRTATARVPLSDAVKDYLLRLPPGGCPKKASDCGRPHGGFDEPDPAVRAAVDRAATLEQLLELLLDRAAEPDQRTPLDHAVIVRGDNELWRGSQWRQRLLLLALNLRAILDVLQAQNNPTPTVDNFAPPAQDKPGLAVNSFAEPRWTSERIADGNRVRISATLDGHFVYEFLLLDNRDMPWLPYVDRERDPDIDGPFDVVDIAGVRGNALWLRPSGFRELVLSAGFNYEVPRFGRQQWRNSVSLETPIAGFVNTGFLKASFGVAGGFFTASERQTHMQGWSLRPAVVLSQSETFVSVPMRWFRYKLPDGGRSTRPALGLRIDQGFSSFITVYLQGGRAPFMQEDGGVRTGSAFAAGLVMAAPLCRVPWLGRVCY